jgi:cytoskeletal protein CcmA (bactofilin family)/ribosomal protein S27E
VAKSSPVKVGVECPHCGFKQQEYAAAKTTMCRQCGAHFSPSEPKRPPPVVPRARIETAGAPAAPSLMRRLDSLWKQQRNTVVECFECKRKQEVSGAATSTICPSCSAHIDMRDYKITTTFSRSIRTTGDVHITSKGDLSSSSVRCRRAVVEGRLRGNLHCAETAIIDVSGKIPARLSAHEVVIEKRREVHFFRRVRVVNIEVRGRMSGEIIAEGLVTVRKHGVLEGNVTAKAINVDKGALFSGALIIGRGHLQQAELLPGETSEKKSEAAAVPLAQPLPAT